ncbi:MAG: carbohydrate kinase family protein [Chlamydiota bacterium]
MSAKRIIVGLGELLWDLLPGGRQLGGAPANFAYFTNLLGDRGIVASRVGEDELGREAAAKVRQLGSSADYLQYDPAHGTGTAQVVVDSAGQPKFEIVQPVAWDFLQWTPAWRQLAERADAVCFGSLAQRSPASRETIQQFLRSTRPQALRVFDVNLRAPFYSAEVLAASLPLAHVIKLNHDELPLVAQLLGIPFSGERAAAEALLRRHGARLVCVTRGGCGSLLLGEQGADEHPGFRVSVADTVGAGDAFTAALVHYYLLAASLAKMNESANRVGAWVASQVGATPIPPGGKFASGP